MFARAPRGLAALAALSLACGDAGTGPTDPPPLLAGLPRPLTAVESDLAGASNRFAFGLLAQAQSTDPGASVFLSPLSASMALGMTLNGAAGSTFAEMRQALGFGPLTQPEINAGYRGLLDLLLDLDRSTEIQVANAIWAETGFPFLPSFMASGEQWFDAEIRNGDFDDPATLAAVNSWVSAQTRGRIPTLLDAFDPQTVMALLNAVYFKGQWREAFDRSDTRTAPFHAPSGDVMVATMHREGKVAYVEQPDFQAVDLLYGNGGFAMTIVLPRTGLSPAALTATLGEPGWRQLVAGLAERTVALALPRFRMEYRRDLSADLRALGMVLAFDDQRADFSNLAAPPIQLFISSVVQKTFVDVNEEGTEAAAATAVQVGVTSMPQVTEVRVDRPFLVVIRERFSGTILFLGQVTQVPAA